MVKDAETHAAEDKKAREGIEARNNAESVVYSTEKALKDYGDKISPSERGNIESAVQELKDALANSSSTPDEIKSKTERVQQASMELGQKVYESAQQAQQQSQPGSSADNGSSASSGSSSSSNDSGTMDADFEEVK